MTWIDVRQQMPTKEDADEKDRVFWMSDRGSLYAASWDQKYVEDAIAWMSIPKYTPLPEIPEGYRLLRQEEYGQRQHPKAMYLLVEREWRPIAFVEDAYHEVCTYIVPIEPQYRPFRNAEEFRPFRDRWWRFRMRSQIRPPSYYDEHGFRGISWEDSFDRLEFEDGTPFGILVE